MGEKSKLEGFPEQFKQNIEDADQQIENPEEHIEAIRRMIEEAGITVGSRVIIITRDHPNPERKPSIIRSMQLEESEPGFNADSAPTKNAFFALKNIKSIEKEENENIKDPDEALNSIKISIENLLKSHEEELEDYGVAHLLQLELEGIEETTGPNPRMNPEAALAHAQGMLETILNSFVKKDESATQSIIERQLRQILAEIEKTTGPSQEYYKK